MVPYFFVRGPMYTIYYDTVEKVERAEIAISLSQAYWCYLPGDGREVKILRYKGIDLFDTEQEALARLLSNLQERRDEIDEVIRTVRSKYKKYTDEMLGVKQVWHR